MLHRDSTEPTPTTASTPRPVVPNSDATDGRWMTQGRSPPTLTGNGGAPTTTTTMHASNTTTTRSHYGSRPNTTTPVPRQFLLPVVSGHVDPATWNAVTACIRETLPPSLRGGNVGPHGPSTVHGHVDDATVETNHPPSSTHVTPEQTQWLTLQYTLEEQMLQRNALREKLTRWQDARIQAVDDIRTERKQEHERRLRVLEDTHRTRYETAVETRKRQWRESIETTCREQRRKERERTARLAQENVDTDTNETPVSADTTGHETKDSEPGPEEPKNEDPVQLPSQIAREKVQTYQTELEALQEQRTEMIWLLKKVIKAEEKQRKTNEEGKKVLTNMTTSKPA
jgi:hypothetical protein